MMKMKNKMFNEDEDDFFVPNNGNRKNKNKSKYAKVVTNDTSDNSKGGFKSQLRMKRDKGDTPLDTNKSGLDQNSRNNNTDEDMVNDNDSDSRKKNKNQSK